MAQNEMKAMRDMPWRVRSTEGLGVGGRHGDQLEPYIERKLGAKLLKSLLQLAFELFNHGQ